MTNYLSYAQDVPVTKRAQVIVVGGGPAGIAILARPRHRLPRNNHWPYLNVSS